MHECIRGGIFAEVHLRERRGCKGRCPMSAVGISVRQTPRSYQENRSDGMYVGLGAMY